MNLEQNVVLLTEIVMTIVLFLGCLTAHVIGDFLIQNDWMASNKKLPHNQGRCICFIHVLTYGVPFTLLLWLGLTWWGLVAILIQHYWQDRSHFIKKLMDISGKAQFASAPMAPWSLIITDNIFHIIFIELVLVLQFFIS